MDEELAINQARATDDGTAGELDAVEPNQDTMDEMNDETSTLQPNESADVLEMVAREKEAMEKDFGVKRARFVELFKQKEIELSDAREAIDSANGERDELLSQVLQLQNELDECKSQVAIVECTAENLVDEEKRKCRDEIASLQQIIKESMAEAMLVKSKYESEMSRMKRLNEKLDAEIQESRMGPVSTDTKEGVLLSMTKTLAKRVSGLNTHSQSVDSVHENLEEGMKKAQEDAEVLRSLVVPLEEEIKALKEKLRAADDELRSYESNAAMKNFAGQIVTESSIDQQRSTLMFDGENEMDEKLKGLHKGLQAEKASRSDLEMYVSVLQSQKSMLQTEADELRKELGDVCQLLDKEKREHKELKQTWQMANDKFLECQKVQSDDLRRIQSVLTSEQQKVVVELFKKDSVHEGSVDSQPNSKRSSPIPFPSSPRSRKLTSLARQSILQEEVSQSCLEVEISFEGKGDTSMPTLLESTSSNDTVDEQQNSPITTDEDTVRRRDNGDEEVIDQSLVKRSIGDKSELLLLQEEVRLLKERPFKPCDMCSNYETQLQRAQERNVELQRKTKSLEKSNEWHLTDLRDEQRAKQELEEKLTYLSVEMQNQLTELYKKTEENERMHLEARHASDEYVRWAKNRLHELAAGRDELQTELNRLQSENDKLVGKHSAHSQQMQSEVINLPEAVDDMHHLLLRLQEDLIIAKVAKEHLDETLHSEILFLKERVVGEQQTRESNENVLTQECDSLRQEVAILESIKEQLKGEQTRRVETERNLRDVQQRFSECQSKHKQITATLTKKLEDGVKAKDKMDAEMAQLRMKVQTLQTDLDNNEAVQRDFVKLSQSLQVQLEKIRESEKEVRWQHEEDMDECSNCKQQFSVTRRRHHCRHCGRIFCADCTSKVVLSGPMRRPSKVCDVCHTLLVPDTAPYFSTEPPHTPD